MEEEFDAIEIERLRRGATKDLIEDEILICECMCVSALDIRNLFKNSKIVDLEVLKEQLRVGQGCSSCLKSFEQWKDKIF